MNTLPLGSDTIDRWGNPSGRTQSERRLKISFVKDLLPSFFLALPFLGIAYTLTGGINTMLMQINEQYGVGGGAVQVAAAEAVAVCEDEAADAYTRCNDAAKGAARQIALD